MRAEGPLLAKIVVATLLVAANASAQSSAANPPAAALGWSGPGTESGCLGRSGLVLAVDEYLGQRSFEGAGRGGSLVVHVSVEKRASFGWRAIVQLKSPNGEVLGDRELVSEGDTCASLDEPLTLAVALMVDRELSRPSVVRAAKKPKSAKKPPRQKRRAATAAALDPPGAETLRVRLDGTLLGAVRTLPEPTLGIDVGAELGLLRWLGTRVHAVALLPRSQRLRGAAEVRLGMFQTGLQACPSAAVGWAELGVCVGVEAGVLTASTSGFDAAETTGSLFWGGSGTARARFRVAQDFSVGVTGGGLVPYRRDRFVYRYEGESLPIFRSAAVSWWVGAGAVLTL